MKPGRLLGVLNKQLAENRYVAGDFYSIADMAIWPWATLWEGQEQPLDDKPHLAQMLDEVGADLRCKRPRAGGGITRSGTTVSSRPLVTAKRRYNGSKRGRDEAGGVRGAKGRKGRDRIEEEEGKKERERERGKLLFG